MDCHGLTLMCFVENPFHSVSLWKSWRNVAKCLKPSQVAAECDRRLCGDDLPANFVCDEFLKTCRSIVVQTLNDDYFAFLNHQGRLKFFRSALQSLAEKNRASGRCLRVLDLGAGAGQLSLFVLQALPNAKVLALEACSEFCGMAKETLSRAGYADAVQVQHALSCCIELSEKDAVDVVLCEPYDIFLTGELRRKFLTYLQPFKAIHNPPWAPLYLYIGWRWQVAFGCVINSSSCTIAHGIP